MSIPPIYQHLLPRAPYGVTFLFSARLVDPLQVATSYNAYDVSTEQVIEEFRGLLATKAFTRGHNSEIVSISPPSRRALGLPRPVIQRLHC